MARSTNPDRRRRLAAAALLVLAAAPLGAQELENWYPEDNAPPPGTHYPIEVPPLPRDLAGIPAAERGFINHTYAVVLDTLRAKTVLMYALQERDGVELAHALAAFRATSAAGLAKLAAEPVPPGLEKLAADVTAGLTHLGSALAQAVEHRLAGGALPEILDLADAYTASRRLRGAWTKLSQRYDGADPAVLKSLYSHLCAVDVF